MDSNLLKTKSIEQWSATQSTGAKAQAHAQGMDLTLLGIGAIIGTGIFVLPERGSESGGGGDRPRYVAAGLASASRRSATRSSRR